MQGPAGPMHHDQLIMIATRALGGEALGTPCSQSCKGCGVVIAQSAAECACMARNHSLWHRPTVSVSD